MVAQSGISDGAVRESTYMSLTVYSRNDHWGEVARAVGFEAKSNIGHNRYLLGLFLVKSRSINVL